MAPAERDARCKLAFLARYQTIYSVLTAWSDLLRRTAAKDSTAHLRYTVQAGAQDVWNVVTVYTLPSRWRRHTGLAAHLVAISDRAAACAATPRTVVKQTGVE